MERACLSRVGALIEKRQPDAMATADKLACIRMGAVLMTVRDFFLKKGAHELIQRSYLKLQFAFFFFFPLLSFSELFKEKRERKRKGVIYRMYLRNYY